MDLQLDRILNRCHLKPDTGCWIWDGSFSTWGYGQCKYKGANIPAHLFFYMYFNGEVPEGKEIHHTCSDKTCVNPIHLIAVTHAENTRAKKSTKLSPQKVLEIMALYVSGMPQREIADMFGVAQMTISQTVRGERWKDLSVAPVIAPQTED